jgi:ketosteroid isomerase-like protein
LTESTPAAHRAIVERYFEMMQRGDPELAGLFCEDVCWIAPQSSPVGRRHEGLAAVLELMQTGVDLYDMSQPMDLETEAVAAEGQHVFVELTLRAKTRAGEPYANHYVFVFRFRGGRIAEIHEHLDTHYTQRMLFDPVGQNSRLDGVQS